MKRVHRIVSVSSTYAGRLIQSVISYPCTSMDSANGAHIRSRFDRWKMESFTNNRRYSNYHNDRRRSASSNRSNTSARSDVKNGDNFSCGFHGYNKYSALWNRSAKCIVCVSRVLNILTFS